MGEEAIEPAISLLKHPDPLIKRRAIHAICKIIKKMKNEYFYPFDKELYPSYDRIRKMQYDSDEKIRFGN